MRARSPILLTAPGRERGEADVPRRTPAAPEPVAPLGVRGLPPSMGPAFEGAASLDDLLRAHSTATLRLVRANGPFDLTRPRAWMPPSPRASFASGRGPGLAIRFRFPRTS